MNSQNSRLEDTKNKISIALNMLNQGETGTFQITKWPDEENRSTKDCDALAQDNEGRTLAIEHTRIETFENQAQDSQRFVETFEPIIPQIEKHLKCKICITLPTLALTIGQNWQGIANALQNYLIEKGDSLTWGDTRHENVPGIPFHFVVDRNQARSGLARWAPQINRVEEFAKLIERALKRKKGQLAQYKEQGYRTMLILDSEDIALVGYIEAYKAFLIASNFSIVEPFDCIWFLRMWGPDSLYNLCFQGPDKLMQQVNPSNFGIVPSKHNYWREIIESERSSGA